MPFKSKKFKETNCIKALFVVEYKWKDKPFQIKSQK